MKDINARDGTNLPEDPRELTPEEKSQIYKEEFFDRLKIDKVAEIPGMKDQAPQLSEQIFDAGVLHGPENAGTMLQKAIDQHMGSDLRVPVKDDTNKKVYDGRVGPDTRDVLTKAIKAGKLEAINDTMVEMRLEFMRSLTNYEKNKNGWEARAGSFFSSR